MLAREIAVPKDSLLHRYSSQDGAYTDCFEVMLPINATMEEFVGAFYTTWLFRMERFVLTLARRRWITDADARALAAGDAETFAIWRVEARVDNQLLLADDSGHTRSYLSLASNEGGVARLIFGSAVVPTEGRDLPAWVRLTVPLHKFYSKALLRLAERRLRKV
jgi:hypothetical protein